ncbi:hypothetical protein NEMBOFW57_009197 [Staphylotrichum longicolle]|uniref:Uncharacterized protein n=1 Tax=Staphylotrichum longicolle TaxID=669026 RepID=A0AAD4HUI0_9PEZI|nr:hypothetical protein NEMBOFW57_009197 [Staphylotrichum longicolle]
MSVLEQRVFVRLAAIIELEVPLAVENMSARAMRDMVGNKCGPAASMVYYGQLWVALSLWERHRRMENNFAGTSEEAQLVVGQVTLNNSVAINEMVLRLERVLCIANGDPVVIDEAEEVIYLPVLR